MNARKMGHNLRGKRRDLFLWPVLYTLVLFVIMPLMHENSSIIDPDYTVVYPPATPTKRYTMKDVPPVFGNVTIVYGNNLRSCKQILYSDSKAPNDLFYFPSSLIREYRRFFHFKNIYASGRYILATSDGIVDLYPNLTYLPYLDKPTEGAYDHVVYLATLWGQVFGHWIHDCLSSLMTMPQQILDKSLLLVPFDYNISIQFLAILGIPESKVLHLNGSYLFARNLYIQIPLEPVNALSVVGLPTLRQKLHDSLQLGRIPATKYVFTNRPPNQQRYIENMEEFFEGAKKEFPEYHWESFMIPLGNVTETARCMATIKVWVVPSGSNVFNCIFMNKNSGVCIIMSELPDYPNFGVGFAIDIPMVGFTNKFKHWKTTGGKCNAQVGLLSLQKLFNVLKNGYYPPGAFSYAFDLRKIVQKVEEYPNMPISIAPTNNYESIIL